MKGKTAGLSILTVGAIGGLLWYLSKGTSISTAVKSLQFRNPKIKFGSPSLLSVPANISIDVFNPTSTAIPVDYLSGNILYNGKSLSNFQVDGKASNLKIKAQSTTSVPFTVAISNLNSVSALTSIITSLFAGYSNPIVLQVTGIFYAMGMDIPYSFFYDVVNQKVVTPGISGKQGVNGIAGVKATLEFSSNGELEKYFTGKRMAKKVVFSKN